MRRNGDPPKPRPLYAPEKPPRSGLASLLRLAKSLLPFATCLGPFCCPSLVDPAPEDSQKPGGSGFGETFPAGDLGSAKPACRLRVTRDLPTSPPPPSGPCCQCPRPGSWVPAVRPASARARACVSSPSEHMQTHTLTRTHTPKLTQLPLTPQPQDTHPSRHPCAHAPGHTPHPGPHASPRRWACPHASTCKSVDTHA